MAAAPILVWAPILWLMEGDGDDLSQAAAGLR